MPHQCVRCGALYNDGDSHILTGCDCGSKLFYYINSKKLERLKQEKQPVLEMSIEERKKVEKDIYDIIGDEIDTNMPVVLDIESVNVLREGSFELDLVQLFNKKNPLVYRLEEGKYMIDLANSFKRRKDSQ